MNIYNFSRVWYRDGFEPSLYFFLQETDELVRLTFPTWKSRILQNTLRYLEHCNAVNEFNKFKLLSFLSNPNKSPITEYKRVVSSDPRVLPLSVYNFLLDNKLATQEDPRQKIVTWIDQSRGISSEDVYNNPYDTGDHLYFQGFHPLQEVLQKQSDSVRQMFSLLDKCGCGCTLHVRSSTLGYTTLHCMNPYCPTKLPFVLADIARGLGIVGLGPSVFESTVWGIFCDNILRHGVPSVRLSDVMNEAYFTQFSGATGDKMMDMWGKLSEYSEPLPSLIKLVSLPYIGDIAAETYTADVIQEMPPDFNTFYRAIKGGRVSDQRVAFILWLYLYDIQHMVNCTQTRLKDAEVILKVAITGSVRLVEENGNIVKFTNKQTYIDALNESLCEADMGQDFRFELKNTVSAACLCLINDSNMESGQARHAENIGVPVIKSNEIFKLVKEVYYE